MARKIGAAEYIAISSRVGTNVERLLQRAVQLASDRVLKELDLPSYGDEEHKKKCVVM